VPAADGNGELPPAMKRPLVEAASKLIELSGMMQKIVYLTLPNILLCCVTC